MRAIKLLEENIGRTLFGINPSHIFLDPSPKEKVGGGGKKIKMDLNKQTDVLGSWIECLMLLKCQYHPEQLTLNVNLIKIPMAFVEKMGKLRLKLIRNCRVLRSLEKEQSWRNPLLYFRTS